MLSAHIRRSKVALLHIPKAGGTALGRVIFDQTRSDETYYFSFFGNDASRGGNRVMVEGIRKGDEQYRSLVANRHFLESGLITGHFSYDLRNIFDEFSLEFATVLREPVGRCISNIYQHSRQNETGTWFGAFDLPSKVADPAGYWREIGSILDEFRGQPIPGLLPHESMMLQNGMCHMIGGTPLHTYTPDVPVERALENLSAFRIALFEQFNESCDAMLRQLAVPVVVDGRTNARGAGYPPIYTGHAMNYAAPGDVMELVQELNQEDIRLYRAATARQAANLQRDPVR